MPVPLFVRASSFVLPLALACAASRAEPLASLQVNPASARAAGAAAAYPLTVLRRTLLQPDSALPAAVARLLTDLARSDATASFTVESLTLAPAPPSTLDALVVKIATLAGSASDSAAPPRETSPGIQVTLDHAADTWTFRRTRAGASTANPPAWPASPSQWPAHAAARIRALNAPSKAPAAPGAAQPATDTPAPAAFQLDVDLSALRRAAPAWFESGPLPRLLSTLNILNARGVSLQARLVSTPTAPALLPPLLHLDLSIASRAAPLESATLVELTTARWPTELTVIPPADAPWVCLVRADLGGPGPATLGGGVAAWIRLGQSLAAATRADADHADADRAAARWSLTHGPSLRRVSGSGTRWLVVWPRTVQGAENPELELVALLPLRDNAAVVDIAAALDDVMKSLAAVSTPLPASAATPGTSPATAPASIPPLAWRTPPIGALNLNSALVTTTTIEKTPCLAALLRFGPADGESIEASAAHLAAALAPVRIRPR
ncbi:hypothetical protein BH11PLA1_BH11PLA1_19520 [soil metagenome]